MKKFIRTLKTLSDRAAQFQETLQLVPPRMAGIRQAVNLTSEQLRQLQADVQMNLASLKADGPDRLVEALHEINGSLAVLHEAGYELGQVEMELSPVPHLIVHLDRVRDVPDTALRSLAAANQPSRVTHALLQAILQAEAMADQVDIEGQVYFRLIVHVGPVPSVRLSWMPEPASPPLTPPTAAASQSHPTPAPSHFAAYGKGSFFAAHAKPTTAPGDAPATIPGPQDAPPTAPPASVAQPATSAATAEAPRSAKQDWGKSALERFKRTPSGSKYPRSA